MLSARHRWTKPLTNGSQIESSTMMRLIAMHIWFLDELGWTTGHLQPSRQKRSTLL
jgi:hypothetical protein